MCLICIDFERGKLTTREARRALGEMVTTLDPEHRKRVEESITQREKAEAKTD